MFWIFFIMFVINAALLLISFASGVSVATWQLVIVLATGAFAFKYWLAKSARESLHREKMDALYGKYERPGDSKRRTYHES